MQIMRSAWLWRSRNCATSAGRPAWYLAGISGLQYQTLVKPSWPYKGTDQLR